MHAFKYFAGASRQALVDDIARELGTRFYYEDVHPLPSAADAPAPTVLRVPLATTMQPKLIEALQKERLEPRPHVQAYLDQAGTQDPGIDPMLVDPRDTRMTQHSADNLPLYERYRFWYGQAESNPDDGRLVAKVGTLRAALAEQGYDFANPAMPTLPRSEPERAPVHERPTGRARPRRRRRRGDS